MHMFNDHLGLLGGSGRTVFDNGSNGFIAEVTQEGALEVIVEARGSGEIEHRLEFGIFLFARHIRYRRIGKQELLAGSRGSGTFATVAKRDGRERRPMSGH